MLLDELITLLSDPKQCLGEALYKTKVLFHQLGRKDRRVISRTASL
jgi:hypothetical protein